MKKHLGLFSAITFALMALIGCGQTEQAPFSTFVLSSSSKQTTIVPHKIYIHSNNEDCGLVLLKTTGYGYREPAAQYSEYRDYTSEIIVSAHSTTNVRFLGWYNNQNRLVESNPVYSFSMPNHDYELEAKWNYFKIEYNLNGGVNDPSNPDHYMIETGMIFLLEPTKFGFDFIGWKYKDNYVSQINSSWVENITLDAIWESKNNPAISKDGKTLTYGLYPQHNVNDSVLVSTLNTLTTPEPNGWYLYNDDYYAKVRATRSGGSFDNGTTVVSRTTYWFKCEPITWNVLSNNNGEYYALSSVLLDAYCYFDYELAGYSPKGYRIKYINGKNVYVYHNNYEYSDIRAWLNGDFYNSAFALGNSYIKTTNVDNGAATTDANRNKYVCNNTRDKVFLPSYEDYINSNYGFSTSTGQSDTRYCKATDWARARGASYTLDSSYLYNGYYWTRSPYSADSDKASTVNIEGSIVSTNWAYVDNTYCCVRPAITIKI